MKILIGDISFCPIDYTLSIRKPRPVASPVAAGHLEKDSDFRIALAAPQSESAENIFGYKFARWEGMKRIEERIWIPLTAVCTLLAGFCAAVDDWPLFWWMLAVWLLLTFVLAACRVKSL